MAKTQAQYGFKPTEEDQRIVEENRQEGESITDVMRRALRLLDQQHWEDQARADMYRLRGEDLSDEPPAWERDKAGNIHITGLGLTVPTRHPGQAM